eukprot:CAMPEP_0202005388 /NCGR_PEP_ID=MMETSP0905-20130828/10439_1 /ASSEMBLY_ACC=CAM_ASM_000554 /TAXON_ID=420261 /ORGANISM="Thalassiosira antarctica, Strain CCMP982" /LENGTH=362 /DNA_ID=CAMNT_0048562943 /DNA_START=57 /DNA_END=1145 /DNA_ORIENTATION=+
MKIVSTLLLSAAGTLPQACAFLVPNSAIVKRPVSHEPLQLALRNHDDDGASIAAKSDVPQRRREFLMQSLGAASLISASSALIAFPSITHADDDDGLLYKRGGKDGGEGDLMSQLYNPDGSLRDDIVVEAQEKAVNLPFSIPSISDDGININIATDGVQPTSSATDAATKLKVSYNLPLKWNQDATSQLPIYYDSSEGKNGISCNRITVYSVSAPKNLDMTTLEKASRVGVAKSLFMDQIPNKYFDQGVSKADLIGGRTVRKPIKSLEEEGEFDEQVYYEFDLAFAPLECPDFKDGNKENLGLGFCPYDKIFLVSATVLKNNKNDKSATLMCSVVECDKLEWKMASSDLKRVRSSFTVERDA